MDNKIYKLVELVGTSSSSIDDAINNAITRANKTLAHLEWFKVKEIRGCIKEGMAIHFQVILKIGFLVNS